jgi:hypothetical protein
MRGKWATFVVMAVLSVGLGAVSAPGVAGTWTMSVEAPPPHGAMTATLSLKQDGKKVTGTFESEHTGHRTLEGEFADGKLSLSTQDAGADPGQAFTITAKLKDDGTLAGYVSSAAGDMTWTAKRVKG